MTGGILAGGWGRRLGAGPKALVRVAGRPLIDIVLDNFAAAGVDRVVCLVNEAGRAVLSHVNDARRTLAIDWIVQTTPSSMHSFLIVLERLAQFGEPRYLMSTVDAVTTPETMREFVARAQSLDGADLVLGLTGVLDDERPVYVQLADRAPRAPSDGVGLGGTPSTRVVALEDHAIATPWVTAGFYLVKPSVLEVRAAVAAAGLGALRELFRYLLAAGWQLHGVPLPPVVDVDRPADVLTAEALLATALRKTTGLPVVRKSEHEV